MTEIKTPKVTLLSWTQHPLETVYSVWEASKGEGPLVTPQQVAQQMEDDPEYAAKVRELFQAVILQKIPISEHIDFVFMIENISVSWREQAVRHRIGTTPSPERVGADYVMAEIPDLADSSWWSQSMRIQNMGQFATNMAYRVPDTLDGRMCEHEGKSARRVFDETMETIQDGYNALVEAGVPMEDARELMPLGAQHRMSWRLNIASLGHIVGKRGCWILQLGIWGPVIQGMIQELVEKVDPIFSEMVTPPCIKGDEFTGCVYHEENRRRYTGDDKLPPCTLHLRHHHLPERMAKGDVIAQAHTQEVQEEYDVPMAAIMRKKAEEYEKFWLRDPYTGKRLEK
jgi:thymidylate synthase ThyX